jgi:hypothetical protein
MTVIVEALQRLNLFAAALEAGGQLFCLKTVIPARRAWLPEVGTKVHQDALTARPDAYMKPAAATALLTGLTIAVLDFGTRGLGVTGVLTLLGALGQLANAIISARWEWPINREINSWSTEPVLDRYTTLRDTWHEKHLAEDRQPAGSDLLHRGVCPAAAGRRLAGRLIGDDPHHHAERLRRRQERSRGRWAPTCPGLSEMENKT